MKKRAASILLGVVISVTLLGCGKNKATVAANESVETEKEGTGEAIEEEVKKEETEEKEAKKAETAKEGTAEEADKKEETKTENGSGEDEEEEEAEKIGILLPQTEDDSRWSVDGETMKTALEEAGYDLEIYFADGDASLQVSQIQELLEEEVSALVIAPVDVFSITDVLSQAKASSVPVFSYDRLIMDTDAVSYYVTFDTRKAGQAIAQEIIKEKDLKKAREDKISYNIEFLMGSPDDNAALFLYNGIMEVLQEYFDDGTLVCQSQKTSFDDTAVMRQSESAAKSVFAGNYDEFYQNGQKPDIICTGYDGYFAGIQEVLKEKGILPGTEEWPLITGVGCQAENVKAVAEGKAAFTIFMDNRSLAEKCASLVDTYLKGDDVEVDDYEQYDNGRKIIGTITCEAQIINEGNYQILVDNGYYEEDEIAPEELPENMPVPEESAQDEEAETEKEISADGEEAPEKTGDGEMTKPEKTITPTQEPEKTPTETLSKTAAAKSQKL